jgi:hypothetical protein
MQAGAEAEVQSESEVHDCRCTPPASGFVLRGPVPGMGVTPQAASNTKAVKTRDWRRRIALLEE